MATTPCVPYVGVFLKDLTFICDGNPDYLRGGLINLHKRRQVRLYACSLEIFVEIFTGQKFLQAQLASCLCIAEKFGGIDFCQCSKGRHILYVMINAGQKLIFV